MSVRLKLRIGSGIVEIEEPTLKAAIQEASVFSEIPKACGKCGRDDLALNHRRAQGYDFYGLRCRDCGAEYAFGQKKDDGALFPKGPWQHPRRGGQDAQPDDEPPRDQWEGGER